MIYTAIYIMIYTRDIVVYIQIYTMIFYMIYTEVYTIYERMHLTEKLCELLLLRKGQLIQVGTHLGLGREKNHILVLTCARQVSTNLQVATQRKAPVYTAASATRQGCVRSISGAPPRTPNTVSLM